MEINGCLLSLVSSPQGVGDSSTGGGSGSGARYGSVALSLDNPLKLMVMGVSKDFTVCRAVTKSGKKCSNFASLASGGHCDYHVQSAYSKMRSQRMEFQNGYVIHSRSIYMTDRSSTVATTNIQTQN